MLWLSIIRGNSYNCNYIKRPLAKASGLVYNQNRKVIGHKFRLPSVVEYYCEIGILNFGRLEDAYFFFVL